MLTIVRYFLTAKTQWAVLLVSVLMVILKILQIKAVSMKMNVWPNHAVKIHPVSTQMALFFANVILAL